MKFIKGFLSGYFLFTSTIFAFTQIPNGSWRDHLPYSRTRKLTEVEDKIYSSTTGGLFSYNKSDNSIQKYSKVNGLSDVKISYLKYSTTYQILVICYENGNIDLIHNDSITNIPDIKRKLMVGDKTIRNILFLENKAYLACGFGIAVLDLLRKEIKETYQFGDQGTQIKVNDITFDGEFLYAATVQGIYKANINSPNLVDYNFWSRITNLPDETAEYKSIVYFNNELITYYRNLLTNFDEIIVMHETNWSEWIFNEPESSYNDLITHNNCLLVLSTSDVRVYDHTYTLIREKSSGNPQSALFDVDNILWIADPSNGLIKSSLNENVTGIAPNGPKYIDVGELEYSNGCIWVASGNETNIWASRGAYKFKNEKWENFNKFTIPELETFYNISEIAIDPLNPDHVFGGSVGYGVADINGNSAIIYDEEDGILETIEGYGHGYIFITGMSFDPDMNLWICSNYSEYPVYVIRPNGNWEKLEFEYDGFGINTLVNEIFATSFGQIWLLMQSKGILVFQENQDGTISEKFFTVKNQEGNLIDKVYSIAEDKDGNIWIGTNKGPVVYYNPINIINENTITGDQIKIPREDGSTNADILLQNERINCITIDGANRKWFATEKSGVFLMSEDAKEEIHNFNADNSPLFSDNVLSIAINHDNGEIFFGTDRGILSFMGQATAGNTDFDNVYVYPNPVREGYEGDITITGLVANANVKITDISGNIVYETKALGGQAIWDGKNFAGDKDFTGVYLVFCTNEDGSKTHVTKLLFIH